MIRRHVLAALAAGVEAGDDDAARAALASTDWVLRGSARRTLERALIDAALVSRAMVSSADPEAMRHVQRVAALSLAGRYEVDATSHDDVTDAYRTLPPVQPPVAPLATLAVAAGAVVLAALLVVAVVQLRAPHRHTRTGVPLPAGAFLTGGTPATDPALEQLLVTDLASLVIATDADRHSGRDARKVDVKALRASPIVTRRGPALAAAWAEMIDALDQSADVPFKSKGFRDAEGQLRARTQVVTDQLAALGLGYHLEADMLEERRSAHAAIFVFRVEDVTYVRAGGEPRRVLALRRLDHLNMTHTLLGMQTEELGDPVVLLDQIEDFVAARVLPVVGEGRTGDRAISYGAPFALGDDAWFRTPLGIDLSAAASEAIRRELAPVVARGGAEAVRRVVIATVRRHEARHGLDNDRASHGDALRYPATLAAHLGPDDPGGAHHRFVLRARAELAAYTSQIASDPVTPQLALWNLANLGFHKDHWGSAESYVAVIVIEGLARRLGITTRGPVVHDGQLDRGRLAALARPLAAESDDDLRRAARELWQDLYAEPFMAIVDQGQIVATLGS